jgi:hypothetical protein
MLSRSSDAGAAMAVTGEDGRRGHETRAEGAVQR